MYVISRNAYYCGDWASLGLRQIPDWIKQQEVDIFDFFLLVFVFSLTFLYILYIFV